VTIEATGPIDASGPIEGPGIVLVPVPADRVDEVVAGDLAPYVAGPGWPRDDTAAALSFRAVRGMTWLVAVDGIVVGEVGTKGPPNADGRVEIGYGLAAPNRGRGLGTRAVAVLVDWLVARDAVRAVIAHVNPDNTPSARLLLRLGFRFVGKAGDEDVYER
jgi:RimJ/RimL family protein N-acetyltransferase